MKADISPAGVLELTPESGAEAFALKKWREQNGGTFSNDEQRSRMAMYLDEEKFFFLSRGIKFKEIPQEGA